MSNPLVLWTDTLYVRSTDNGLTIDVGQKTGGTPHREAVARLGMSFEMAKLLCARLEDAIKKATP